MSFLVADALPQGRVWNLADGEWCSKMPLPDGCGLFEASDVTEFSYTHPGSIDVLALPVRPPLDVLWVESVHVADDTSPNPGPYDRFGALVRCAEGDEGRLWVTIDGYQRASALIEANWRPDMVGAVHKMPFVGGYEIDDRGMLAQPEPGQMSVYLVPQFEVDPKPRPLPKRATVDGDVSPPVAGLLAEVERVEAQRADLEVQVVAQKVRMAELLEDWRPWFENMATFVLRAVAAMNVRNTIREAMPASRQVRRRREREGLVDPAEVTVLKVPGAQRYAAGPGVSAGEAAKAHHAVLGHFAYYGDTHPDGEPRGLLFGRQEGVFWHPPHWRGNREAGEVQHTYKVTPADA